MKTILLLAMSGLLDVPKDQVVIYSSRTEAPAMEKVVVMQKFSNRYHAEDCKLLPFNNLVKFPLKAAQIRGFTACNLCKPAGNN